MKILYHHRTQGEEPESVHIQSIVTALRRAGHEVDLVGPVKLGAPLRSGQNPGRPSALGRIKNSLPRGVVELAQLGYNLRPLLQLAVCLKRNRYDFMYERYALYNIAGLATAKLFGVPFILEVNTPYAQAWGTYFGLRFRRLARALERFTFRRADLIVTVTEVQRASLQQEGVPAERIIVCQNAIDPREFDASCPPVEEVRRQLTSAQMVVGFVGTMNRWQGVQDFAEVVERVVAEHPEVGFLFVGEGEGREPLARELERRGVANRAWLVGRRAHAEIPGFMAAMDIGVLLNSNAYGSPMKLFEYWAMGKPVIAPAVAPVLEVLRDGETGVLIQPGDAQGMARQICRLAAAPELRACLGAAGRRYVLASHTWDRNAESVLQAFTACRQAHGPARARFTDA